MNNLDFLFLISDINLRGGTEIQTLNITQALNEAGYQAKILSITPYNGKDSTILSFDLRTYKTYQKIKQSFINKISCNIILNHYLAKILHTVIIKINPQVLVNQTYDLIHLLPFNEKIKIVQVFNWSILGYEESILQIIHKKKGLNKYLSNFINQYTVKSRHSNIKKCNHLVVLTDNAKKEIKSIDNKVKECNIKVIPNPLKTQQDSSQITSLNNHNIIFVGRLSYEKGVMRLLHIWKEISSQLPDYTLSIYGKGNAEEDMKKYIKENKLRNIIFQGFEPEHHKIYTSADLLLSTSDSEGFGLVFIEAFYFGVPVISFNCPVSPKEVIGNAGVLIKCFDEKQYAKEVILLLKDTERLKELQQKAIKRARLFYEDKIVNKWINLLTE